MEEIQIVNPDPERMIESLRDTGYTFNTAVSDLIDNSIAANATDISIDVAMDLRGTIRFSISDNGTGMDREGLINAMRYGSKIKLDTISLGKFGMGLKTASTAFCRKFSVTSRLSGGQKLLTVTWDLDRVVKAGKWELLISEPTKEIKDRLTKLVGAGSGTIVVWEKVDRLLKTYQDPAGKFARNALKRIINELKEHIGMVYQRFLDPDDNRAPTVRIFVEGDLIRPWDPFCIGESEEIAEAIRPVEINDKNTEFVIRAYVLPRGEDFSNQERVKEAKIGNKLQGIYIYRENRLIHGPDWLDIFQKEPHGSLLRIEFSFDHLLDDAFQIDIKKSRIMLNEDLWNWLADEFLPPLRREADRRYRFGKEIDIVRIAENAHTGSNVNIGSKQEGLETAGVTVLDKDKQEVLIDNPGGKFRFIMPLTEPQRPGEYFVQAVNGITDGMLWQPVLIDGHKAVQINTNHPYYHKVYLPNLGSGVTVQGMDSLLWALCAAELRTVMDSTKQHFLELRFEVSRILRRLVEDLPEAEINEHVEE